LTPAYNVLHGIAIPPKGGIVIGTKMVYGDNGVWEHTGTGLRSFTVAGMVSLRLGLMPMVSPRFERITAEGITLPLFYFIPRFPVDIFP
jgi:hypothetical protein